VRKRGKRGTGGSLKSAGTQGKKERETGGGSDRGHTEKERGGGGRRGREVDRRRGPARHGRGSSRLLRQRWAHASRERREPAANRAGDGRGRLTHGRLTGGARRQRGPVVSGGVLEGASKSEAAAASALTGGPGPHNVGRRNSTWFESKQNSTGFKLISNKLKF
jgi:hypothetical protein